MPTKKGMSCTGCSLQSSGHGFVTIKAPLEFSAIRLLVQGDLPSYDDADSGLPFSGKSGWWLKHNILGNAGLADGEVLYDNTLRCRPFSSKGNSPYPKKKDRENAEAHCKAYSVWAGTPNSIPLLCIADEAAQDQLGLGSVANWHGHVEQRNGRIVGVTYPPSSVMKEPNLLPLVIREVQNTLEAAANPAVLKRPEVVKGIAPYLEGQEAVVDLEWAYDRATKRSGDINIVGISYSGGKSYATYDVASGLDTIKRHFEQGTRIIGHNFIDADLTKLDGSKPISFGHKHLIDTKIVAHLIHPHWSELGLFGLEDLVRYYRPTTAWKHIKADMLEYNGLDTAYNFRLWEDLQIDLSLTDQWHLVEKDQRLGHLTVLMQQKGLRIDSEGLRRFDAQWTAQRAVLAGSMPFNPNSPKQILAYFAGEGIKLLATDIETLEKSYKKKQHPILAKLIGYKDEGKGLKAWFSEEAISLGRIHPKFSVTGTAVARFSCSGPNAQNIPPDYRRFILPDSDDHFIASFDGKNIEGRTCAWNAGDTQMLDDFASGVDIHKLVASRILGKTITEVSKDERQAGKRTVHASNYLETAPSLAGRLYGTATHDNIRKAQKFQDGYFGAYPKTREWQLRLKDQMSKGDVMIRNPFGRVRMVYDRDDHERSKRACHFMGCSTGADVVNQRALDIWEAFGLIPGGIIHDEIFYSLPRGVVGEKLVKSIQELVDGPIKEMGGFKIPFGYKSGPNYGELVDQD